MDDLQQPNVTLCCAQQRVVDLVREGEVERVIFVGVSNSVRIWGRLYYQSAVRGRVVRVGVIREVECLLVTCVL